MICYQDERVVDLPKCSKEELREQIRELEIKNYGHEIDYSKLPRKVHETTIFDTSLGKNVPISEYRKMHHNI